jgi:hypothetical protein
MTDDTLSLARVGANGNQNEKGTAKSKLTDTPIRLQLARMPPHLN